MSKKQQNAKVIARETAAARETEAAIAREEAAEEARETEREEAADDVADLALTDAQVAEVDAIAGTGGMDALNALNVELPRELLPRHRIPF